MEIPNPSDVRPVPSRGYARLPRLQAVGLVLVVLALVGILSVFGWMNGTKRVPNTFLSGENLLDGIASPMSYYAIMAVGATIVIITGGIDISVGSIYMVSAMAAAAVIQHFPVDSPAIVALPTAVGVCLGVGLLCGLVNGLIIVGLRMHPFIVTLGTMGIFRGIAQVTVPFNILPDQNREIPAAVRNFMTREIIPGLQFMPLFIMLLCVIVGFIYLHVMVAGRETYAVGGNEEAARFSGLNVGWIKLRAYLLNGLMAGAAGFVLLGRYGTVSTDSGRGYELPVIAAAVIGGASLTGGRGFAIGALLGTLVIQLIQNGILILNLQQEYNYIIVGIAIISAVAVDRLSEYLRNRRN